MATEDPASVPALASEATEDDYGVSGVPKSGRSAIDLAAAIGAACNTPQPTTSLNEEETETSDPTRSDPEAVRAPNPDDSGPDLLSDEPSATPANTEESARGQQVEEAASVVNGDIDLCRRAVLLQPQEEDVCSICLDEFTEEDPGQATACGHLYHLQCVMQWAQRSRECPLCFRALQLQDEEVNSLLPFGEYIAPPGPGATNPTSVSALAQHMYGVESWELEQLLQRLALSSQQVRSAGRTWQKRSPEAHPKLPLATARPLGRIHPLLLVTSRVSFMAVPAVYLVFVHTRNSRSAQVIVDLLYCLVIRIPS